MAKLDVQFVTNKPTSYYADLEFPGLGPHNNGLALLILTEADYLGGNKAYRQVYFHFYFFNKKRETKDSNSVDV